MVGTKLVSATSEACQGKLPAGSGENPLEAASLRATPGRIEETLASLPMRIMASPSLPEKSLIDNGNGRDATPCQPR